MRWLLVAVLFMSGCSVIVPMPDLKESDLRMGDPVFPPSGYTELCQREPQAPECGGGK